MQHQGVLTKQHRENSLGLRADDTPPGSFDSPSPRGSGSLRMTGESKDQRDPIPRPNRKGGWKFRISAVRRRGICSAPASRSLNNRDRQHFRLTPSGSGADPSPAPSRKLDVGGSG